MSEVMKEESITRQVGAAVNDGWLQGGAFFSSILAGTLVGLGVDWWLGTAPWFVIAGVLLGSYSGFARTWSEIKAQPDPPAVTLQEVRGAAEE